MKLFTKAALAICLVASLSVNAQSKKVKPAAPAKPALPAHSPTSAEAARPSIEQRVAEFRKRNPDVKGFTWEKGMVLVIEKQDGSKEKYEMDKFNDEQAARGKYGRVPVLPAPPPPPAPATGSID